MVTRCDVLAVGAHPDDAELGCGATVARLVASGRVVGILDLTAGETASRGDRHIRAAEATAAARALGVAWRECLGLPDTALDAGDGEQRRTVVAALRAARPRVVLVHHAADPHPDHGAAAALVAASCFLAGVGGYGEGGGSSRPELVLAYPGPRQLIEPTLVVDVSEVYEAKRDALAAHRSQLDPTWSPPDGAAATTLLATSYYLAAVEGRDRAAGSTVGYELGEGFVTVGPASAELLAWLLADGGGGR